MANMPTQFRLTKEESALMDECRRNSFWYRSVPIMAVTTTLMTYRRLNNQMPPKFYGFKLAGAMFASYLLGKASYIPECRRLILQRLPDSNLARSLESKPYDLINDIAQPPEIVPKSTTQNIFGNRTDEDNQQQLQQQPLDFLPAETAEKNSSRKYVTYDELRQRNRAEHATKFAGPKARAETPTPTNAPTSIPVQDNRQLPPLPIISNEQSYAPVSPTPTRRSTVRKNQYGDEVYE